MHHNVTKNEAEAIAIEALTYLVQDSEGLERFFALTGLIRKHHSGCGAIT
jgi:hypothetical protein